MALSIADQYYLVASENYNYNWKEVVENLNYALSYDPNHGPSNCLMGRLYMEQFQDFDSAESYLTRSMAENPTNLETCNCLLDLFLEMQRFDEAQNLIAYVRTLPGGNVSGLYRMESLTLELNGQLSEALDKMDEAIDLCANSNYRSFLMGESERLKDKLNKVTETRYHLA